MNVISQCDKNQMPLMLRCHSLAWVSGVSLAQGQCPQVLTTRRSRSSWVSGVAGWPSGPPGSPGVAIPCKRGSPHHRGQFRRSCGLPAPGGTQESSPRTPLSLLAALTPVQGPGLPLAGSRPRLLESLGTLSGAVHGCPQGGIKTQQLGTCLLLGPAAQPQGGPLPRRDQGRQRVFLLPSAPVFWAVT